MKVPLRVLAFVVVLLGLLVVSGATAAQHRQVRLTVSVTGKGVVRVNGSHALACSTRCRKTFSVRAGSKVTVTARPGTGWAFSPWSGACRSAKPTCSLRLRRAASVAEKFLPPGSTSANPISLGHPAAAEDGWIITVVSATLDATAQILAIPGNTPPPPGAQYTMLNLTATYTGGGSDQLDGNDDLFYAVGAHNAPYDRGCCQGLPPPVLETHGSVFSGQSISGNIYFTIASNDADSLLLYYEGGRGKLWFALR